MLLPTSWATHRSTTAACLFCCMKSCTSSTSSTGCATSWQYWHTFATWDRSTVPDKPPRVGVGGHWTSVPAICCSTETDRSTAPSEDVWLSSIFGGKSVSLECITGQSERSRADFRHFQASFEDLLLRVILDVLHVQCIRDFLVMCYINVSFTYLLTLQLPFPVGYPGIRCITQWVPGVINYPDTARQL